MSKKKKRPKTVPEWLEVWKRPVPGYFPPSPGQLRAVHALVRQERAAEWAKREGERRAEWAKRERERRARYAEWFASLPEG